MKLTRETVDAVLKQSLSGDSADEWLPSICSDWLALHAENERMRILLFRARDLARAKLDYETRADYERAALALALDIDAVLEAPTTAVTK